MSGICVVKLRRENGANLQLHKKFRPDGVHLSRSFVSDDKHFEDQTLKLPSAFLEDLKDLIVMQNIRLELRQN